MVRIVQLSVQYEQWMVTACAHLRWKRNLKVLVLESSLFNSPLYCWTGVFLLKRNGHREFTPWFEDTPIKAWYSRETIEIVFPVSSSFSWFLDKDLNDNSLHNKIKLLLILSESSWLTANVRSRVGASASCRLSSISRRYSKRPKIKSKTWRLPFCCFWSSSVCARWKL